MSAQENQVTYLRWVAKEHPALFAQVEANAINNEIAARQLGYVDDDETLGWLNFVLQAVATVGSAVMGKKQVDKQVALQKKALVLSDAQAAADREQAAQFKLLEVNTERLSRGLPPVNLQGQVVNPASLPLPASLAPYTAASGPLIPGVPNLLTYAGGAVLGFALLKRFGVL